MTRALPSFPWEDETLAWHFTGPTLRDGRPIPLPGVWLTHSSPMIQICRSGLHASPRIIDALGYAPGPTLHRVTMRNVVQWDHDKMVARERRIEWSMDATEVLHDFITRCKRELHDLIGSIAPPAWPHTDKIEIAGANLARRLVWAMARNETRAVGIENTRAVDDDLNHRKEDASAEVDRWLQALVETPR
jgi:hypothetical protein